ncbi:hypothetical protein [Argonema antarcticum]|uniref:hypothetical protein n=1 Tax=Argonema antarcticum TaxID=2942763 RepID=UPI002011D761|nr:hypothetical protein [Argonema antarcticum]MCL1472092.1 hypothetical protein [Argonema antarcticum A004/B2]
MPIPAEINALIERLNDELNQMERSATEGIALARAILKRFPDNFTVIQLFAFLNTSIFFADNARRQLQMRVEALSASAIPRDEDIQEAGEDLAIELGRVLENKMRVSRIKTRLENLQ